VGGEPDRNVGQTGAATGGKRLLGVKVEEKVFESGYGVTPTSGNFLPDRVLPGKTPKSRSAR